MKEQILQSVDDVWQHHCAALNDAIAKTIAKLKNALGLDEYYRHAHDPDHLERDLGPLAATNLDLRSLSRVLGESACSRTMGPDRLKRVQDLISTLDSIKQAWSTAVPESAFVDIEEDEQEIRDRAEQHLRQIGHVFQSLRIAQLEIRSAYEPQTHDAVFADFSWRQLGPGELRLSPPFLVIARLDHESGANLRKMMALLESGMPIKIAALRSSLREVYSAAFGVSVPSALTMETFPLAMRGVYFLQTSVAAPDYEKQLFEGLTAPWPAVISVLCPRDDEEQAEFASRAAGAVRSRTFPICVYDPERANRFGMCLDLSANPSPHTLWTTQTLSGCDPQGQPIEVEEAFTAAHFAASEAEFAAELTDPPAIADDLISLTDYLAFSRQQRAGKLPFISLAGKDGNIIRKVVSPTLALQCSERLHLWRTLQGICGIDNPPVSTTGAAPQNDSVAEQQVPQSRQDTDEDAAQRERAAVASAVRKIVAQLTGVEPSDI